jgi:hypothetical protein
LRIFSPFFNPKSRQAGGRKSKQAGHEFCGKMPEILVPQYEMAKVDEAKEDISFQVMVALNTLIAGMASILLGVFAAFLLRFIEHIRSQATHSS